MGAMCSGGTSSAAYIEKPKSGIAKNGQYVVDGVVIPRREMSKEEAARRGLKEDSWRGSMFGLTGITGAPGGAPSVFSDAIPTVSHPVVQPYRRR